MRDNTLSTVRRDGKSIGIRVTPKSSRSSLSALGLQPGDIIQRIGTVDVSGGMPSPNALIRSLQGKDSVSVTILRGDKTLKVDISQ
jgi:type II secretory pathway component PulC